MSLPTIKAALSELFAELLDMHPSLVYWTDDGTPVNDEQCLLSWVSTVPEADAREEIDPETLEPTVYESVRAQLQVVIESTHRDRADMLARRLALRIQRRSSLAALKAAGVALVMAPGAVSDRSYEDRLGDGAWVPAAAFEIPLRFVSSDADPVPVKRATTVRVTGETNDRNFDQSVEDPNG